MAKETEKTPLAPKEATTTKITVETLLETHKVYNQNIAAWSFWGLAYSGGKEFIDFSLPRHTRESDANHKERQEEGVCFNYSSIIIDLFNFYLTEKPAVRDLGQLVDDLSWKEFKKDADLYGTNFDVFLNESQKLAAIYGAVGILIDKPTSKNTVLAEDVTMGIYPYCSAFTLPNILDWTHERDEITNRPTLTYLKLLDFENRYLLWWRDHWEIWKIPEADSGTQFRAHRYKDTSDYAPEPGYNKHVNETGTPVSALTSNAVPVLVKEGENPLGEIPFIWFQNIKHIMDPYIGVSDIKEIARITSSIIRNVSYGEEVIKFAAFPQARRPMESDSSEGAPASNDAGVTAILEFDPELGEAGKPDWLNAEVQEPVEAILSWILRKVAETYQLAHLSGIKAHEKSDQVRSGVALRYEYQQLALVLSKKSENLTETELGIIKYWTMWQANATWADDIQINRSKEFSIDDLSQNLENAIMSDTLIPEPLFKKELMKVVAKKVLPDVPDERMLEIFGNIDALTDEELMPQDDGSPDPRIGSRDTKDIRQSIAEGWADRASNVGKVGEAFSITERED